jgi:hypothetical protein
MKSFQIVVAVVWLLAGSGLAPAAGPARYVVRDAGGSTLGPVVRDATEANARYGLADASLVWLAMPVAGSNVRLLVGSDGPWDTKGITPLLFESDDCSGAPLMSQVDDAALRDAIVFDIRIYWPEGPGERHVIHSRASLVREPEECGAALTSPQVCCTPLAAGTIHVAAPAVSLPLVDLRLTPPLRVEAAS